jgi:UDP-N-acetylglucosamine:LPS N-acetylglucosamine transferase/nucleoside-diphosphate-sugar epimerase
VKVLIVTAATGQGHLTAARALRDGFAAAGSDISPEVLDTCVHPAIRSAAASYNFFLRRPPSWMRGYYAAVHLLRLPRVGAALTRGWARRMLETERPDLVVSVHPILNLGIANALERHAPAIPLAIVLTDPCPPFWRGWAEPRAARTVVPTAAAAQQLIAWGVPSERVEVGGMPVPASFRNQATEDSRRAVRESLGLEADRFTLLINAGSAGRRTTEWVLRSLVGAANLHRRIQVVFVAGHNPLLGQRAARLATPFPTAVLDWSEDISALLDVADATFTKAGGLSVSEAMAKGVPLLVDACEGVLPQEAGTADWIEREGWGWKVRRPEEVVRILTETSTSQWTDCRERARAGVRGDAETIARDLLALAPERSTPRPARHAGTTPTTLVTGATGALAPFLLHRLLHEDGDGSRFVCLVRRPEAPEILRRRLAAICPPCAELVREPRFEFLQGDVAVSIPDAGKVDRVWHFASDLRMDPGAEDAVFATNLGGMKRVLDLCRRSGATLFHVSTAYVCGTRGGTVREDELLCGQAFRNAYESSKAQAEALVQEYLQTNPGAVFRPSIVMGDTRTGVTMTFQGFYKVVLGALRLQDRLGTDGSGSLAGRGSSLAVTLPCASPEERVNLVAAEYITDLLFRLHRNPLALGRTFHLVNPSPPTIRELFDVLAEVIGVAGARLVPEGETVEEESSGEMRALGSYLGDQMAVYFPYFAGNHPTFDMGNVGKLCGGVPPHPSFDHSVWERLLHYAVEREFAAVY